MDVAASDSIASGQLLKWTNYVHGWQVRYFRLSAEGMFSYSLSDEDEVSSRGSVKISKMVMQLHKHSEVRFDVVTPTATWYLRALSGEDRTSWCSLIHKYTWDIGSTGADNDALIGSSSPKVVTDLDNKLEELHSFKDCLSLQMTSLKSKLIADCPGAASQLTAVQVSVAGVVATAATCVYAIQQRETELQLQIRSEQERVRQLELLYSAAKRENSQLIKSTNQRGPHLYEDEFYDAIEDTLEKMGEVEDTIEKLGDITLDKETKAEDMTEGAKAQGCHGNGTVQHRMYIQMQDLIKKYVELSKQDPEIDPSWLPLSKSGETRMYRKEEQKESVLLDYLVATTVVQGVTAGEMAEVFHSGELKLKWDHTIEGDKKLETLDELCSVYHQVLKRVWPTAQRDMVYASHKQQLEEVGEHPAWIVCNVSCDHPAVPEASSGYTRATIEVVLFCQTICESTTPTRKDVSCKIVYSASVNPGGWAPSAAVRAISQREYPKFLKKISAFAQDHVKSAPLMM